MPALCIGRNKRRAAYKSTTKNEEDIPGLLCCQSRAYQPRCCGHFFSLSSCQRQGRGIFYYKKGRHLFIIPAHRTTLPHDLVEGEGSDRGAREDAASAAAATSFEGPDGIQPQPAREKQCVSGSRWRTHPACGHRGENYLSLCVFSLSLGWHSRTSNRPVVNTFMEIIHPAATKFKFKQNREKETNESRVDYAKHKRAIICAAVFMVSNLNRQCCWDNKFTTRFFV